MLNLNGLLDNLICQNVIQLTKEKFRDYTKYETPESYILHEQKIIDDDTLLKICSEHYGLELEEPSRTYMPQEIITSFKGSNSVPVNYNYTARIVTCVYIPEIEFEDNIIIPNHKVVYVPTTLHYYINSFIMHYGVFDDILPISGREVFRMIIEDAIKNNVSDITITNSRESLIAYYNHKKRKVSTNFVFPGRLMDEIIKVMTIKSPYDSNRREAKYVGYEIDSYYRARIVINKNIFGYVSTLRIYSNAAVNYTLEDLNINEETIDMLRTHSKSMTNGLRLVVGETMSGKNTTNLAVIKELVDECIHKIVSIELPVEQVIDGVEQIEVEYLNEYKENIESLIHQNPDYIYIAEIKDTTADAVMKICNTGKRVFSTLHSNSVEDTISRLMDITNLSSNRIIQILHSIVFQDLRRIGDEVYPFTEFVVLTDELKMELYDKSFSEIITILKREKRGGFRSGLL